MATISADDIYKCNFLNGNLQMSLKISLKFVPKVRINNIPALVLILYWYQPGDRPLSGAMIDSLLLHIYTSLSLNELSVNLSETTAKPSQQQNKEQKANGRLLIILEYPFCFTKRIIWWNKNYMWSKNRPTIISYWILNKNSSKVKLQYHYFGQPYLFGNGHE